MRADSALSSVAGALLEGSIMHRIYGAFIASVLGALAPAFAVIAAESTAVPQPALKVEPIAEKTVGTLPTGPLFWRVETFPSVDKAQASAGTWSLVAKADGKVWLFTLGAAGGATPGGTKVADVGPIPPVTAQTYLLRVNEASGAPGSLTPVHTHAGSEAFFVLSGEQTIRTTHGVMRVKAGQPEAGHGAGMIMQVSSSGSTNLRSLVMFVVDASKPFSTPAEFPKSP